MKTFLSLFPWKFWLFVLVLAGGSLRFQKLDWGEGYFFHPDELHIAFAVEKLSFPFGMDPHFYAYGSFPVYLIYFTKLLIGPFSNVHPLLIGRFFSAGFSTLSLFVIFFLARGLFRDTFLALFSVALAAFTPGLIQQAHFATPESILTFFILLTLWFWLKWWEGRNSSMLFLSSVWFGLGIGTKITALFSLPLFIVLHLSRFSLSSARVFLSHAASFGLSIVLVFGTFLLVSPYSLFSFTDFRSAVAYEIGVGRGMPVVFYTRQFIDTVPLLFQVQRILPYALGPLLLLFGSIGFLIMVVDLIMRRFQAKQVPFRPAIILAAFLFWFVPSVLVFAKWTRVLVPMFPWFSLFSSYLFYRIGVGKHFLSQNGLRLAAIVLVFLPTLVWSLMVSSVYLRADVRVLATAWMNAHLPSSSFFLTEAGNTFEVPLWGDFQKSAFDFYNLEDREVLREQLPKLLAQSDYFIVQSRRIFANHRPFTAQFPFTSRFYYFLFSGDLGFEPIATFSSYPRLALGNFAVDVPDEMAEETWSVFDHPVVRLYKNTGRFTKEEYEKLLSL